MERLPWSVREGLYSSQSLDYWMSPEWLKAHQLPSNYILITGAERSGKSFWVAKEMDPHLLVPQKGKVSRFYLFGPTFTEPRVEFEYIEDDLRRLGALDESLLSKPKEGAWRLGAQLGGTTISQLETFSTETDTRIGAITADGAGCCEVGKMSESAVKRIFGRVSSTGGFVVMSGTLEWANRWCHDWYNMGQAQNEIGLQSLAVPMWANRHEFPGGRQDPKILQLKAVYDDDEYMERVVGKPAPAKGLVVQGFHPTKDGRPWHVQNIQFQPDLPVYLWQDPGRATAYAIEVVQRIGDSIFAIDEVYAQGEDTAAIIDYCMGQPWWGNIQPSNPGVADRDISKRTAAGSVAEIWYEKTRFRFWSPYVWQESDLIDRLSTTLREVHDGSPTFIASPRCKGLICEAGHGPPPVPGAGQWRYQTDVAGRIQREKPHDAWNHAWKAVGYGLRYCFGWVKRERHRTSFNRLRRAEVARL